MMGRRTLTLDLEDGSVTGAHLAVERLGFICESRGQDAMKGCHGDDQSQVEPQTMSSSDDSNLLGKLSNRLGKEQYL